MFVRKANTDTSVLLHRETLQKHGSHDQKTHGRKGGGGGGGGDVGQSDVGSSSATPKRNNEAISSILQGQVANAENKLSNFDASRGGKKYDTLSEDDQSIWERASTEISAGRKLLGDAKRAKTDKEYRNKLSRASEKFDNAFQELEGAENSRLLSAGSNLDTALGKIENLLLPPEERGGGDRMS